METILTKETYARERLASSPLAALGKPRNEVAAGEQDIQISSPSSFNLKNTRVTI